MRVGFDREQATWENEVQLISLSSLNTPQYCDNTAPTIPSGDLGPLFFNFDILQRFNSAHMVLMYYFRIGNLLPAYHAKRKPVTLTRGRDPASSTAAWYEPSE